MFEELQEQFRNLTQLVTQAMNFQNKRNNSDDESDHGGGARNGINMLSEAENDSFE